MDSPVAGACVLLAWRGDAYGGWQLQPHVPTVQAALESVLAKLMGETRVVARAAGRLDAGVHACGQLVAFPVVRPRTLQALWRGLNGLLPPDIVCLAIAPCAADFDPRRANRGKTYRYRVLPRTARCPFRATSAWHVGRSLDVAAMVEAARFLEGRHDFSTFRAVGCAARHPVRVVRSVTVTELEDEVAIVVDGEAFLRHQVRIMAGCLVEVGLGKRPPTWVGEIRNACDRTLAARTAPAHGLWLERVHLAEPLKWAAGGDSVWKPW